MLTNQKVVLAARPDGVPEASDFRVEDEPVEDPGPGEVVVAVEVLSIDAFIRTMLDERAFHGSTPLGGTVMALGVGTVEASGSDDLQVGEVVCGPLFAQRYARLPAAMLRRLDVGTVPATAYLGALGMTTGLTAYFGMREVGAVREGDTVVVSAAAGAVGSIAGQVARLSGAARVIGIAGGPAKGSFLVDELGFDAAVDYRSGDVDGQLARLAPDGIDVFFDNVGGDVLDAALLHLREGARVVICGAVSQYSDMDHVSGPRNYLKLAERNATMAGFVVSRFAPQFPEAEAAMTRWLASGELVVHEQVEEGLDRFPEALRMLFTGGHRGKLLVRVA